MDKDDRDILSLLQQELDFIEQGGYGRSVRTPWKPQSIFQDSLTCLNFADPARSHPCTECHLVNFVSPEQRAAGVPCHQIPLNEAGDTVESLELQDNQAKTEATMKDWLRKQIKRIEAERARHSLLN
jgi:hypothetical protein